MGRESRRHEKCQMILVDTSVWIDYFNGKDNKHTEYLDGALIEGNVALGDLIFLEILQGIREDKEYQRVTSLLGRLDQYTLVDKNMVAHCANHYRSLRKKGITIRKTADVIIATFCIQNHIPLLYTDKDFDPFVEYLKLRAVDQNNAKRG
jgi:predicted nucleic acid-binding protein